MSELKSHVKIRRGSERNFGLTFFFVFILISFYPLIIEQNINFYFFALGIIFLVLALFIPNLLTIPNNLWFKLGTRLGSVISPIVMALIYVITILPIGFAGKLLGKEFLEEELDKRRTSYWKPKGQPNSMKKQY